MNRTCVAAGLVLAAALSTTAVGPASAAPSHHAAGPRTSTRTGAYTVTASVNRTEPLQGSKVKVKGSVKPAAPGSRVTLQLKYAGQKRWKSVGSARLTAASRFKLTDKVTSVRTRKYRVVKAAGAHRSAGRSGSLKVTVFGWRDLTSIRPATASAFGATGSVSINGVGYPSSLRSYVFSSPASASIDFNLNRDCKAFRSVAGLEDSSPANGTASVSMSADGTVKYAGSFGLTQSAPVAFDLTHVFRLSISATLTNAGVAAIGTPQVLCSF